MKKKAATIRVPAWCCAALLLWFCLPAAAQGLEERLGALMAEHEAVGLAVVVVKDNAVVYRNSLGWKDRELRIPLEEGDLFRIASISKSFAAVAVLQLAERGRLSLEDEVGELIGFPVRNPAFPDAPITLGMLLNHTASISDGQGYSSLEIIDPRRNEDWRRSYAGHAPGERYAYSNLGYNMVGAIVERASGQRFDAYVEANVLAPLGLHGGYAPDTLDAARFARLYRYREGEGFVRSDRAYEPLGERLASYRMGHSTAMLSPTGGLKISAPDLASYMRVLINDGEWEGVRILAPEQARRMREPAVDIDGDSGYGLAIRSDRTLVPGAVLTGHTGSAHGLYSAMFFDARRRHGIVVITNGARDIEVRTAAIRLLHGYFLADPASP